MEVLFDNLEKEWLCKQKEVSESRSSFIYMVISDTIGQKNVSLLKFLLPRRPLTFGKNCFCGMMIVKARLE